MKKKFSVMLLIIMTLSLAACGKNISQKDKINTSRLKEDKTVMEKVDSTTKSIGNNHMKIQIGKDSFSATLADNSSTEALREILEKGPLTIDMHDYGNMEKVGLLGVDLPRNDEQITTRAGDLSLYQGNSFVIYYAPNSWKFTRIGRIDNVSQAELQETLGKGNVIVTLSLD